MIFRIVGVATLITALFAFTYGQDRSAPLAPLRLEVASFDKGDEGIFVKVLPYNANESKRYLNHDLIDHGFQPVEISIQNNTDRTYFVHPDEMGMPVASEGQVSNKYLINSIPRSIAFKVLGFLFWPLMIPGTADTIRTYVKSREIQRDLFAKTIKEEYVPPYSTLLRVAYVPRGNYNPDFTISLIDVATSQRVDFHSGLVASS
jgi:hypothetical protein